MHLFTNEVLFYCLLACLLTCLFALLCLLFCCFEIITNNLNGKIKQRSLCWPSSKLAFEMWSKLQIPGENCAGQSILLKVFLKCTWQQNVTYHLGMRYLLKNVSTAYGGLLFYFMVLFLGKTCCNPQRSTTANGMYTTLIVLFCFNFVAFNFINSLLAFKL